MKTFNVSNANDEPVCKIESGTTILEALLKNNKFPTFSCGMGMCAQCRTQLISGEIKIIKEKNVYDKISNNEIIICISIPVTDIKLAI